MGGINIFVAPAKYLRAFPEAILGAGVGQHLRQAQGEEKGNVAMRQSCCGNADICFIQALCGVESGQELIVAGPDMRLGCAL